ncbi:MAG: hypothetical protein SFU55_05060 [Methylophilus sp.]|nr:hypothetical protein [Methylophilus sp.]
MPSNLYVLPAYGKAITLDDQGVYYVLNRQSGKIQTVIQLIYHEDEWYLFQLQPTSDQDECCWTVLAENTNCTLQSMTSEQITHHFIKPEFAEPKGAWQVMANSQYGFGKFTPLNTEDEIAYAVLMFSEGELQNVIRMHKSEENLMQNAAAQITYKQVVFA